MKKLLLIFLLAFLTNEISAQTTVVGRQAALYGFKSETGDIVDKFSAFLQSDEEKKREGQQLNAIFLEVWNSGYFSDADKLKIAGFLNFMFEEQNAKKPFPDYERYILMLQRFVETNANKANYAVWDTYLHHFIITKKQRMYKTKDLFTFTDSLLTGNVVFHNNAVLWKSSNNNYTFQLDTLNKDTIILVKFNSLDLYYFARGDTGVIKNTSGVFNLATEMWQGNNGRITWKRTGLDENSTYADISNYNISLIKADFTIDSVSFKNQLVPNLLFGRLHEALRSNVTPDRAIFPTFEAYDSAVVIQNPQPFDEVTYMGKFKMEGANFEGSAEDNAIAYLYFYRNNQLAVKVKSRSVSFRENKITATNAEAIIYTNNDSIFHPGLLFTYMVSPPDSQPAKRVCRFERIEQGYGNCEFYDSYHQVYVDVEYIEWDFSLDRIDMKMLPGYFTADGFFESANRFDGQSYLRYNTFTSENYLRLMYYFSMPWLPNENVSNMDTIKEFHISQFVASLNKGQTRYSVNQMELEVLKMVDGLFVQYDSESKMCKLLPKFFFYNQVVNSKVDYDVIEIISKYEVRNDTTFVIPQNVTQQQSVEMELNQRQMVSNEERYISTFDLNNMDMNIRGVDRVDISPKEIDTAGFEKGVIIRPDPQQILLQGNRNIQYDGILEAKRLEFQGIDFHFDYDNFKMELDSVAYMRIKLKVIDSVLNAGTSNEQVFKVPQYIGSVVENISGELYINDPDNKSNRDTVVNKQHPYLITDSPSRVYYDSLQTKPNFLDPFAFEKEPIMEGIYSRGDFYFEVQPDTFNVNEIKISNQADSTGNNFALTGKFYSTIFQPINEDLVLQIDTTYDAEGNFDVSYSLGFYRKNMEKYPLYEVDGVAKGEAFMGVKLSNIGLRGAGYVSYITSKSYSDDFLFFPERMDAVTDSFYIEEQYTEPEFPRVIGYNAYINWQPFQDSLYATGGTDYEAHSAWGFVSDKFREPNIGMRPKSPFQMYANILFDDFTDFNGILAVTPAGLRGNGKMKFYTAVMESFVFDMKSTLFRSDSTTLKIEAAGNEQDTAFYINSALGLIDFEARLGQFKKNDVASNIIFKQNQYMCFMDTCTWDIDRNEIEVGASEAQYDANGRVGAEYISIHPDQDSLRFISYKSGFKIDEQIITCYEVDSINVANGIIYPDGQNVVIGLAADMEPLANAFIIADTTSRLHRLYDVNVDILGKFNIVGSTDDVNAKYDYIDQNGTVQTIDFDKIGVHNVNEYFGKDSIAAENVMYATGYIKTDAGFTLSPDYEYNGAVTLNSFREHLTFDGSTRILHACEALFPYYELKFRGEIAPDSIYIPVPRQPLSPEGEKINVGIFITADSTDLYPTFFNKRISTRDTSLISGEGFLHYDSINRIYEVASIEKLNNRDLPGQYVSLSPDYCVMDGEGEMNFGAKLGQVSLFTAGKVKHELSNKETTFDLMMIVDFFFNDAATEFMVNKIMEASFADPSDLARDIYVKGLKELMPINEVDELTNEAATYGTYRRFPKDLEKMFVFTDVKMRWDPYERQYVSIGDIGIGNITKYSINKKIGGKIVVQRRSTGDKITIYLEISRSNWFFFEYSSSTEIMFAIASTSYQEFNDKVSTEKEKNRKRQIQGLPDFTYGLGVETMRTQFLSRMEDMGEEGE